MKVEKLTEKAFMAQVTQMATWFGWRVYHTYDSRRSSAGFPDLVLVHPGRGLIFAELKVGRGKLTPEQQAWLDDLQAANIRACCWWPEDWKYIEFVLRGE